MKRFNTDARMTEIFTYHGAFFAFSNEQFDKQKKEGTEYESLGAGLICPIGQGASLFANMDVVHQEKISWELANNTTKEIIWYELANHECQITMSYTDVIELLQPYGITGKQIAEEWPGYIAHCREHDLF